VEIRGDVIFEDVVIVPLQKMIKKRAAALLARAFVEDSEVITIIRKPRRVRQRILQSHYSILISSFLRYNASACVLAGGELVGVMLVCAPGEEPIGVKELARFFLRMLLQLNPGSFRRGWVSAQDDEHHRPCEPHYYLSTLGIEPKRQGNGIGSVLLKYLIERADKENTAIYLSSTNPKALPLYERFGFNTISITSPLGVPNHHMVRNGIK